MYEALARHNGGAEPVEGYLEILSGPWRPWSSFIALASQGEWSLFRHGDDGARRPAAASVQ